MAIGNLYGTGIRRYTNFYTGTSAVKDSDSAGRTEGTAADAGTEKSAAAGSAAGVSKEAAEIQNSSAADRVSILKQLTGGIRQDLTVQKSQYGKSIGDVSLSDDAAKYYESLKVRYGNMNFVLVSDDVKDAVQSSAAAYSTAGKTTVLINESKIEKMASDPSYRQKYESILTNAQSQMSSIASAVQKNSGSGNDILASFGMSVNENGDTSYFAVFNKQQKNLNESLSAQRAEKAAEKKKTEKAQAKKDAAAKREEKIRNRRTEEKKAAAADEDDATEKTDDAEETYGISDFNEDDYDVLTSSTSEGLIDRIRDYLASNAANTEGVHFSAQA